MLHVQAAIALSDEQVEQVCDAYEAMLAALERATADQDAILARRAQNPGAAWIAQNVSVALFDSKVELRPIDIQAAVVKTVYSNRRTSSRYQ